VTSSWLPISIVVFGAIAACDSQAPAPDTDAAVSIDDAPGPDAFEPFTCGPSDVCDPQTQFCYGISVGMLTAAPVDGCNAFPESCPSPPTCDCVTSLVTDCNGILSCEQEGDRITVVCSYP
jgi:hypothetical protein